MNRRFLEAIGVAGAVIALIVLLKLAPAPVASQATTATAKAGATAKTGPAPKTAWGEPDLQGIWANEYETPLQRPTRYANKEFFTDAERAELDRQRAGMRTFSDRVAPRGTEQDVAGAYNAVFQSRRPTGRRTSLIVDPPDGRMPPVTAGVQKRRAELREFQLALMQAVETCKTTHDAACAGVKHGPPSPRLAEQAPHYVTQFAFLNRADGPEDFGLGERCMSGNLPDFAGYRRIVQSPGAITIFYDVGQGQGWSRTIPITGSPHLPSNVRQWWGDSRGRWEGNTLVVDVIHFNDQTWFDRAGNFHSDALHVTERYTLVDADHINYAAIVEDPKVFTRPWNMSMVLYRHKEKNFQLLDYECYSFDFQNLYPFPDIGAPK